VVASRRASLYLVSRTGQGFVGELSATCVCRLGSENIERRPESGGSGRFLTLG